MSDNRPFQHTQPGMTPCESVRDDLPVWSIGALDDDERSDIDRHLAACPPCRAEADRWEATSASLPLALPPSTPSGAVRDRLMDRIAADQMAAVTRRPCLSGSTNTASSPPTPPRRFPWSQVLVAPLLIALIVMSAWAFNLQDRVDTLESDDNGAVVSSGGNQMLPQGMQTFSLKTECQECTSAGRLLADPQQANALMLAWGLDPGMVHQVWCVDKNGAKTLVASLQVGPTGDVVQPLQFEQPIAGYAQIYVMSRNDEQEQMMQMDGTPISTPLVPDEQVR